ncbi:hypothetical protein Q8F55_007336 [Vanrija albida]|uniref:Transcription factor domain-containing protein n=1 Tax=Vanrija albida TaxID=181172 RepID=A0ABR3PZU5_9TREE
MRPPVDPVDAGGRPATSSSVDVSDRLNPPDFPRSHLHRLTLGMLSEAQAVQMLDIFYEQLNPQIAVLDRGYHTFDHIKRASPILLSSVLAAVAKLFAFDLYQRMLNHAQTLINHKGMSGDGMYDIYDVQAILIQVYYKHPSDRTVWIRLGMALRIAQQLRLNESYHRPLPDAPVEKRRQLNRERTWMLLICEFWGARTVKLLLTGRAGFDRTYSYHFDLPLTVRPHEIFDAEEWARDHADLGIGTDWHLACSHDHGSYDDMLAMYRKSSGMTEAWSRQMLAQISNGYRKHLWRWFDSPDFLASVLSPREQRILRVDPLNQLLLVKEAELDLTSWESQTDLAEWMSLADQLVQQLELTTEDRGFLYLQDTSSLGMSSLALNLYKTEFLGGASALIPENLEIENEYWSTMFSTTSEYPQIMAQLQPLATLPG